MARSLNDVMEFDHVVQVHPDGSVTDAPAGIYAPELNDGALESGAGWSLMNGYSSQYGYSGPIMHPSESIGGGMERDILATPGYYVSIVSYHAPDAESGETEDDDLADGWAVAYRPVP